jgi:hypothetical protein
MIDLTYFRNNLDKLKLHIARKKFTCNIDLAEDLDLKRREAITAAEQGSGRAKKYQYRNVSTA